jgi:phosphoserine phosphatase RsbU/P
MKRRILNIMLGLYIVLMFINVSIEANYALRVFYATGIDESSDPGWSVEHRRDLARLTEIRPDGPAANVLRPGDEIVSINGQAQNSWLEAASAFNNIPAGSRYKITVRRNGSLLDFTLMTAPFPSIASVLRAISPLTFLVIPAILLFSSLALFLLKSDDKLALLLSVIFSSIIGNIYPGYLFTQWQWLGIILALASSVSVLFYPVFFHFFLLFPDSRGSLSPFLRRFPNFERYLYYPFLLIIVPLNILVSIFYFFAPERAAYWETRYAWFNYILIGLFISYLVVGLFSLIVNYRKANLPLRRKLRVVVAGSLAGLTPILLAIFALAYPRAKLDVSFLVWLIAVAILTFPLFPLSFIYAIVRHQVIPVRIIIRRSLRYLFVRKGSILLELGIVGAVLALLLNYVFARMQIGVLAVGVVSGAVAILAWQIAQWLHYKIIAPAIDRAFFRRAYNAQLILSELSQALRVMSDWRDETLAFVSMRIQEALQTDNVTIFIRDDKSADYLCAVSSHYSDQGQIAVASSTYLKLSRDAFAMQRLAESSRPLSVNFDDPNSWALALDSQESETLMKIRSSLILPIATKDQLLGAISLGPRLGDLPFSREDRELLQAVAAQLSFAIENAQLVRHKVEEERMRRELEFASEVQRRLFPQRQPQLSQLEFCGVCHPARDVGGDYYDFLELGNEQLGIAVADVSGKGISAALLMSVIQASLRAQAPKANGQMTELIASMNRLLCEATDSNNYATFFYALLDWKTRRLTYVNAGHNPPILVRAALGKVASAVNGALSLANGHSPPSDDSISLLTTGGPVIGLLENCTYENCTVEVRSGDVLVAYTDGLSEARNPEGEEFGEERLKQLVVDNAELRADELRDQIISSIRSWQRGEPQYDDMTMVIVKMK